MSGLELPGKRFPVIGMGGEGWGLALDAILGPFQSVSQAGFP